MSQIGGDMGRRLQTAIITALHEKLLHVPSGVSKGIIATLVGSDASKLGDLGWDIHYIWSSPVILFAALALCWRLVGAAVLAGVGVALLLMPVNFSVMSGLSSTQEAIQRHQQRRMAATSEAVGSILGVKLLGWERRVASIIGMSRAMELRHVRKFMFAIACLISVAWSLPTLMCCATFTAFALMGGKLTASVVFPALYLLQLTTWPMLQLPYVIGALASACTSMNRVTLFLDGREVAAGCRAGGTAAPVPATAGAASLRAAASGGDAGSASAAAAGAAGVSADAKALSAAALRPPATREGGAAIRLEVAALRWPKPSRVTARRRAQRGTDGGFSSKPAGGASASKSDSEARLIEADHLLSVSASGSTSASATSALAPHGARPASAKRRGSTPRKPVLHDIDLTIPRGQLVAVVGPVGSGKSSLLAAILGELEDATGPADEHEGRGGAPVFGVLGRVGLAPQASWVRSLTARQNIGLGLDDAQGGGGVPGRDYRTSVSVCCLEPDFRQLAQGEETEVGESGVSLSGGQRARITLARAVHSGCEVLLLDDPLSAVDAHVGAELFHTAIRTTLAGCTRVLVTHQLQFLPLVDRVLVMNNGRIEHDGSYEELAAAGVEFASLLEQGDEAPGTAEAGGMDGLSPPPTPAHAEGALAAPAADFATSLASPQRAIIAHLSRATSIGSEPSIVPTRTTASKTPAALVEDEDRCTGTVDSAVYWAYLRSLGGWGFALAFAAMSIGLELLDTASAALLALWADASSGGLQNPPPFASTTDPSAAYWLSGYLTMGLLVAGVSLVRNFSWFGATYRASRTLHDRVIGGLLRAPMRFWTATPTGRVLNRLSKDVTVVDQDLPDNVSDVILCVMEVLARLVTIGIASPIFLAVFAPVTVFYWTVTRYYRASSRELKRLEAIAGSPVQALFADTVDGLTSIRAFGRQPAERRAMLSALDNRNTAEFASRMASRWITIRIEGTGAIIVGAVGALAVGTTVPAVASWLGGVKSLLPLALTYAISLTGSLNWFVRCATLSEAEFSRVERLYHFAGLQAEAPLVGSGRLCEEDAAVVSGPCEAGRAPAVPPEDDASEADELGGASALGAPAGVGGRQASTDSDRLFRAASKLLGSTPAVDGAWAGTEELRRQTQTPEQLCRAPPSWPRRGELRLRHVWMRYRPDLAPVLRSVSVAIPAGCRVGVVGRTGAGKSSLFAALFRTVELCKGSILLDGVDMSTVGLRTVRAAIAAVPQEPVMWSGTLRTALDPAGPVKASAARPSAPVPARRAFAGSDSPTDDGDEPDADEDVDENENEEDNSATERGDLLSRCVCGDPTRPLSAGEHAGSIRWDPEWRVPEKPPPTDAAMLEALAAVGLGEWAATFTLDGRVEEGGANLSLGTRQLLALARTLLRDCRVVALDEATASVSPAEDNCIQAALRSAFRGRTVLTIAHRLPTIIEYDRVLVMNSGRVEEWGSPAQLLRVPGADAARGAEARCRITGQFASMVADTGPDSERLLRAVATRSVMADAEGDKI